MIYVKKLIKKCQKGTLRPRQDNRERLNLRKTIKEGDHMKLKIRSPTKRYPL